MAYNRQRFEVFVMQAEQATQQVDVEKTGGWVDIEPIGEACSLTQQDSFHLATYLESLGWAVVKFTNPPKLLLTPKGHEEIAKLKWPKWKRWLKENEWSIAICSGLSCIAAVVIAIIALVISIVK